MKKVKKLVMTNLPIIGFILFALGGTYFVIGQDQALGHFSVLGGVVSLLGLFLFVYGNMVLDEKGDNR